MSDLIELNCRRYRKPQCPTVVICVDGCDPEYLERGIPDGVLPTIGSFHRTGYLGVADAGWLHEILRTFPIIRRPDAGAPQR